MVKLWVEEQLADTLADMADGILCDRHLEATRESSRYHRQVSRQRVHSTWSSSHRLKSSEDSGIVVGSPSMNFNMSQEAVEEIVQMALGMYDRSSLSGRRKSFASMRMGASTGSSQLQVSTMRALSCTEEHSSVGERRERVLERRHSAAVPLLGGHVAVATHQRERTLAISAWHSQTHSVPASRADSADSAEQHAAQTSADRANSDYVYSGRPESQQASYDVTNGTLAESQSAKSSSNGTLDTQQAKPVCNGEVESEQHDSDTLSSTPDIPCPPPLPPTGLLPGALLGDEQKKSTHTAPESRDKTGLSADPEGELSRKLWEAEMVITDLERENTSLWYRAEKAQDDLEVLEQVYHEVTCDQKKKNEELFSARREVDRLSKELNEKEQALCRATSLLRKCGLLASVAGEQGQCVREVSGGHSGTRPANHPEEPCQCEHQAAPRKSSRVSVSEV